MHLRRIMVSRLDHLALHESDCLHRTAGQVFGDIPQPEQLDRFEASSTPFEVKLESPPPAVAIKHEEADEPVSREPSSTSDVSAPADPIPIPAHRPTPPLPALIPLPPPSEPGPTPPSQYSWMSENERLQLLQTRHNALMLQLHLQIQAMHQTQLSLALQIANTVPALTPPYPPAPLGQLPALNAAYLPPFSAPLPSPAVEFPFAPIKMDLKDETAPVYNHWLSTNPPLP